MDVHLCSRHLNHHKHFHLQHTALFPHTTQLWEPKSAWSGQVNHWSAFPKSCLHWNNTLHTPIQIFKKYLEKRSSSQVIEPNGTKYSRLLDSLSQQNNAKPSSHRLHIKYFEHYKNSPPFKCSNDVLLLLLLNTNQFILITLVPDNAETVGLLRSVMGSTFKYCIEVQIWGTCALCISIFSYFLLLLEYSKGNIVLSKL